MSKSAERALVDLVQRIAGVLDDGKAVDVRVLDVRRLTVITDFMIVASGRSARQVRALTDKVLEAARAEGAAVVGVEGETQAEWVLVDLGDIVVHVMHPAVRSHYNLEELWGEKEVRIKPKAKAKPAAKRRARGKTARRRGRQ